MKSIIYYGGEFELMQLRWEEGIGLGHGKGIKKELIGAVRDDRRVPFPSHYNYGLSKLDQGLSEYTVYRGV